MTLPTKPTLDGRPRIRRATLALGVGVALPTLLLAAGWTFASMRERETRAREERLLLARSAEVVRGAVEESLEELRAREDARPFYLWNHFYTPPDVLAVGDAVATTPLAREPDDRRVVGYFQIDPGGRVRTPYEPEPGTTSSERAKTITARVGEERYGPLRALASTTNEAAPVDVVGGVLARGGAPSRAREGEAEPQHGAYTTSLNTMANALADELKQAESSPSKRRAIVEEGKKAPKVSRKDVDWSPTQQALVPSTAPAKAKKKPAPSKNVADDPGGVFGGEGDVLARPPPPAPPTPTPTPTLPTTAAEVAYTPMAFSRAGDDIVLSRVVSHLGVSSVQGLVLDRAHVVGAWLPAVVARHAVVPYGSDAAAPPAVVGRDDPRPCAVREPLGDVLDDVDLCFPPTALAAGVADAAFFLEGGALLGLLFAIGAALVVLDRAGRKSEELSRQKSAFITAVSHELRTPLTTLRMHAELLREGLVAADKHRKFHDDMVQESVRLSRLVENVLEVSRLEEGRRPLRRARIDLCSHVRSVVDAQASFVAARGFAVEHDVTAGPIECDVDAQAIEQVVVNLIDNAVKYAADGEKVVRVVVDAEGDVARIRVLDRGPGVPVDQRDKVFDRFFRVQRPGKEHVVGTGLGLALVRDLARAHGGDAAIGARDGGGAEVVVTVPCA